MRPLSYESRAWAETNITYTVIETLIAVFFDKYKADHRLVSEILRDRELAKQLHPPHKRTEDYPTNKT
jgi:hypothetical protein